MNTTGIQNYLSNVFRPIVSYDPATSNFTPLLELSNIDNFSGNTITVFKAAVGDSANNVYVGKEAGNEYNVTRGVVNTTAVGFGSGSNTSNVSNSVYYGTRAGAGNTTVRDIIAAGYEAGRGPGGSSNIFIGSGTGAKLDGTIGSSNLFIGHGISSVSAVSNQIRIGLAQRIPIAADICHNWVGLGGIVNPRDLSFSSIDLSGSTQIRGNLGINITPGARTLDVSGNFRARDSSGNILDFFNGVTRSSGGYSSIQGSIVAPVGNTDPIGTLKRGLIHISAIDRDISGNHAFYSIFAFTPQAHTVVTALSNGQTNISIATSNIRISNGIVGRTYDYNITYFPLP